jgi:molybdopterin-guanine dinucleotide biosynthesis adapter protein
MKVFGIVGWKNSGKTTLVERLVRDIGERGWTVSTIKHAHHAFDVDQPGTDSHRHRHAGAREVLLSSGLRWVLMHELRGEAEADLDALLAKLSPVDLVLVEGFKNSASHKIEVRVGQGARPSIAETDDKVIAVAQNAGPVPRGLPVFDPDDIAAIAGFILQQTGLV